ncbi:hypothetical protein EJ04DRAFT_268861 [Polyplosphaeria fusca]|uniref:Uncharacterized protein n=1 Tax=Polyplosphaeria fusca TaxID=682080 RepID=A0A9P4QYT1_9PLEO|nr:hypothetical protein EJ04DRAFT_268861 [Polyplosphaeria fusca]
MLLSIKSIYPPSRGLHGIEQWLAQMIAITLIPLITLVLGLLCYFFVYRRFPVVSDWPPGPKGMVFPGLEQFGVSLAFTHVFASKHSHWSTALYMGLRCLNESYLSHIGLDRSRSIGGVRCTSSGSSIHRSNQ